MQLPVGITYEGKQYGHVETAPLTGRALKIIRNAVSGDSVDANMYIEVLKNGIKAIDGWQGAIPVSLLRKMYWADAEYIFMQLAKDETADDNPVVMRECPSCKRRVKIPFDFDQVRVIFLDDPDTESEFNNPERTLPFTLSSPIDTLDAERTPYTNGKLGLLTVEDWVQIFPRGKFKLGSVSLGSITAAIYELGPAGKGQDRKISPVDIEGLTARDIKKLERLYNKNEPGPRSTTGVCPECGAEIDLTVDWVQDFLAFSPV